ncbi:unnamed protein product [Orchesella dallaii]|uniref:G-protein coupled receptors family 1 profile domain-containing protein n=1 Tax=Orchesella dallaii TaxID=48710 RepID=A0ABP1Q5E0_9HEXA
MDAALIFTAVLTLLICFFGLIGNALCLLVLLHKDMGNSSYVFLLQGLTVSDILLLTISTLRTFSNLHFVNIGNPHLQTFFFFWDWICTSGTKFYTVAISLERFFVITFPLVAHRVVTVKRSKLFALSVLVFVILLSCFSYLYSCCIDKGSFNIYVAIVLHFLPFTIVLILNVFIFIGIRNFRALRRSVKKPSENSEDESASIMLFAVVVVFGFCYSFEFIRRIMNYISPEYMTQWKHYDYPINHLADIFYVLNSSVNFLIYCLLGSTFRAVFLKIFRARFGWLREKFGEEKTENSVVSRSEASKVSQSSSSLAVSKECGLDEI